MADIDVPGAWSIWPPGAWLAGFIKGTTNAGTTYIQNIEALDLVVSGKIFLWFPIVSQWELFVAMETTILIQSATKPNAVNPPTHMVHIKFYQYWPTSFRDILL